MKNFSKYLQVRVVLHYSLILCCYLFFRSNYYVSSLTLSSGQRIASRTVSVLPHLQQDVNIQTIFDNENQLLKKKKSFLDLPAIEAWGMKYGLKEHHLKTLYRVIFNNDPSVTTTIIPELNNELNIDDKSREKEGFSMVQMTKERLTAAGFPKRQAELLCDEFAYTCSIVRITSSESGGYKFVVRLPSGKLVETVLIRHERNDGKNVRFTVCVSSQVGCAKKCSFCATGRMGLQDQLSSGEILEQVFLARIFLDTQQQRQKQEQHDLSSSSLAADRSINNNNNKLIGGKMIRNCVFMGMGEPLDNYDAVHEALRGLTHQCLFGLKAKHVTVSTVGASASKIQQLADEAPQVSLALSLHSAIQKSRERLIPTAYANPINKLGSALDYHSERCGRGAMIEYLLIDGMNDSDDEAMALVDFCVQRKGKVFVNLIPYNPTFAGDDFGYSTPSDERIYTFHRRLKSLGINTLVRWSSATGRDTNGACGQLALVTSSSSSSSLSSTTTTVSA